MAGYDCQVASKVQLNNRKREKMKKTLINRTHGFFPISCSFLMLISFLYDYRNKVFFCWKILIFILEVSVIIVDIDDYEKRWRGINEKNVQDAFSGHFWVTLISNGYKNKIYTWLLLSSPLSSNAHEELRKNVQIFLYTKNFLTLNNCCLNLLYLRDQKHITASTTKFRKLLPPVTLSNYFKTYFLNFVAYVYTKQVGKLFLLCFFNHQHLLL